MDGNAFLEDINREFCRLKKLAESALDQVDDPQFFQQIDSESNSLAILVKHLNGNMRSRWTDFLTRDGEKPDRNRDSEFVVEQTDTRERLMQCWNSVWKQVFDTLRSLETHHLKAEVTIRGESHSVPQALQRQLLHCSYHVGQMVFLARHLAGETWQSLSIPKGKSEEFFSGPDRYMERGKS